VSGPFLECNFTFCLCKHPGVAVRVSKAVLETKRCLVRRCRSVSLRDSSRPIGQASELHEQCVLNWASP